MAKTSEQASVPDKMETQAEKQAASTQEENEHVPQPDNSMEEKVLITLFKDDDRYKEPLYVAVNGRRFLIQRGVPVEVPRYVADVIQNSLTQDNVAQMMVSRLEADYEASTKEKAGL